MQYLKKYTHKERWILLVYTALWFVAEKSWNIRYAAPFKEGKHI